MRQIQRFEKWHVLPCNEIAVKLNTDLSSGLSKKEARGRCARFGKNTLFLHRTSCLRSAFMRPIGAFSAILALFSFVFGLFFERSDVAISSLIAFALISALTISFSVRYERALSKQSVLSMPMVRVKRDGVIYTTNADNITVGDVIVLKAGDVIPADARLISSEDLTVDTYTGTSEKGFFYRRDDKGANVRYEYDDKVFAPEGKNMVYGASRVISGEAEAVVVGIGVNTHVGAIIGGISPETGYEGKGTSVEKYVKYCEMLFLLIAVVISLIGALVLGKNGLFLSATAALALAFANSGVVLLESISYMKARELARMNSDDAGKILLPKSHALEDSASLTDVFVLEKYALTDGSYSVREFYTAAQRFALNDVDTKVNNGFFECVYMTEVINPRSEDFEGALMSAADCIGYDAQALRIRLRDANAHVVWSSGIPFFTLSGTFEDERVSFAFCDNMAALELCRYFVGSSGELSFMNNLMRQEALEFLNSSQNAGCRVRAYFKMTSDTPIFMGMAAFSEHSFENVFDTVSSIEKLGVKVAFFIRGESTSELAYFRDLGIVSESNPPIFASELLKEGKSLLDVYGSGNVFLGFSESEIQTLQLMLKKKKRSTAVLAVSAEEFDLIKNADVAFACDTIDYPSSKLQDALFDNLPCEGTKNSSRSTQAIKLESDVLIKRSTDDSPDGPIGAMLKLIRASRSIVWRKSLMLSYFVSVQALRGVLAVLSLVLGLGAFGSFSILFFGALLDVLAFWTLSTYKRSDIKALKRAKDALENPFKFSIRRIGTALLFGVAASLFAFVSSFFTRLPAGMFVCSCVILCSAALLILTLYEWGVKNVFSIIMPIHIIAAAMIFLIAIVLSIIPKVNYALCIEGIASPYWCVSLLFAPFGFFVLYTFYPQLIKKLKSLKK